MRALFDVNVLIALFDQEHIHHERAHHWWAQNGEHGWASCALTQNGVVRILSQPAYPNPISVAQALETLAEQIAATDHLFWLGNISLADESRFDRSKLLGAKHLTDVYLLGLAVRNDGRLVTFDRAIPASAVIGARSRHLVIL